MFKLYLKHRNLFCNIAYFTLIILIFFVFTFRIFTDFDFTDEAQNYIKLFYLIRDNNIYGIDFNIHQTFLFIVYPILKIFYLIDPIFLETNLIILTKIIYLFLFLIGMYAFLKSIQNKNLFIILAFLIIPISLLKHFFSLYYDNIVILGLLYFFILKYFHNNINITYLILINFFIGLGNPALGILFFIIALTNLESRQQLINYFIFTVIIAILLSSIVFYFNIININDLLVSLNQSSEMSNFKILERPKQLGFLILLTIFYFLIRQNKINNYFYKLYEIKNYFLYILILFFILSSILILQTKYYNYYFIYIFILLFTLLAINNKDKKNKDIFVISDCSIYFLIVQSFISGNSLAKIDLPVVSALPFFLIHLYSQNNNYKNIARILCTIILISISYVSINKSYRTDNLFGLKHQIITRFGDRYVSEEKRDVYEEFSEIFNKFSFKNNNSLLVIGSAPWIYLIDDIKPDTKNLFYDINESTFFNYIDFYEIKVNNVISLISTSASNNYISNFNCKIVNINKNNIKKLNQQIDRNYQNKINLCKISN